MGYRSDVCLALNNTGVAALKEKLASPDTSKNTRSEVESLLAYADKHLVDAESGAECWKWNDVKWYDDPLYYPDVDFVEGFITELDDDNYRFMRIGEDYDDAEVRGYFLDDPFGLTFSRQIVLDC